MKRWFCFVLATAFLAGGVLSITIAQCGDVVTINNKYTKRLKAPVTFGHKKHADAIKCTECHHTWKKEEQKEPKKCGECHKEAAEGKKLGTKLAHHNQCMGCHKNLKSQGKKTGPTVKCSDCHPSKK